MADAKHTVGVDIGGTKIAAGVVSAEGELLEKVKVATPATDPEAVEDAVAELVLDLRSRHDVVAVGLSAAGYIDAGRSTVMFAPNLAWRDEPLRDDVAERVGVPVVVENDGNAAAWGEFRYGAGADINDLLLVAIGTGIGGGIVLNGQLLRGAFGIAAEIGHLRVVPDGLICGCGRHGCWEQYASGRALVRMGQERLNERSPRASRLRDIVGDDTEAVTGQLITQLAQAGDELSIALLAELGRWLGEGVASLAAVLDPAVVVIGGGVSAAGDLVMIPLERSFMENLPGDPDLPKLELRQARLGNDAAIIGAADLARQP